MTMPHLMNCDHYEEGWCLDCVKKMHDEMEEHIAEAKAAKVRFQHNANEWKAGSGYIPLMLGGLRKCIEAAFTHHDEFMDTFWSGWRDNGIWELHECYMASERTKIVVLREDGGFVTNAISTDKFILWVESVSSR